MHLQLNFVNACFCTQGEKATEIRTEFHLYVVDAYISLMLHVSVFKQV